MTSLLPVGVVCYVCFLGGYVLTWVRLFSQETIKEDLLLIIWFLYKPWKQMFIINRLFDLHIIQINILSVHRHIFATININNRQERTRFKYPNTPRKLYPGFYL